MTAYDRRISDWSSDVFPSDLDRALPDIGEQRSPVKLGALEADIGGDVFRRRIEDRARFEFAQFPRDRVEFLRGRYLGRWLRHLRLGFGLQIGRAPCREKVCQSV